MASTQPMAAPSGQLHPKMKVSSPAPSRSVRSAFGAVKGGVTTYTWKLSHHVAGLVSEPYFPVFCRTRWRRRGNVMTYGSGRYQSARKQASKQANE